MAVAQLEADMESTQQEIVKLRLDAEAAFVFFDFVVFDPHSDAARKGTENGELYSRLAKPTTKSICVLAKRNGDYALEPVSVSGYDLHSVCRIYASMA